MKVKSKTRVLALVCAIVMIITLLAPITVVAAVKSEDLTSVAKLNEQITARLVEIDSYFEDSGTGEYGLLYQMRLLTEYEMYVIYLNQYGGSYGFSNSEIKFYNSKVTDYLTKFNNFYSTSDGSFTAVTLTNNTDDVISSIRSNLNTEIPNYIRSMLSSINTEYQDKTDDSAKDAFLKDNATLLANLYKNLIVFQNVPNTINNLALDVNGKTTKFSSTMSKNNSALNATIKQIAADYTEILSYGKQLATASVQVDSLEIDTSKELAEIFSNGKLNEEKTLDFEDTPMLSQSYLAILSCSSVYTPFSSYVGDPAFTTALREVALEESEEVVDTLLETYNKAKDIRKPLYVRDIDENGNPTGTAEILTIERFIEDIQAGNVGALCMAKGDFHYNSDAASWIYSQFSYAVSDNKTSVLENSSVEDEENNTEDNSEESSEGNSEESSEESTTESTTENSKKKSNDSTDAGNKKSLLDRIKSLFSFASNDLTKAYATSTSEESTEEGSTEESVGDETSTSGSNSESGLDTTSAETIGKTLTNTIIIGDKNAATFKSALVACDGVDNNSLKSNRVYFKTNNKMTIDDLATSKNIYKQVEKILNADSDTTFNIVLMFGHYDINDTYNADNSDDMEKQAEKVANRVNKLATGWSNSNNYKVTMSSVLGVNQGDTDKEIAWGNSQVLAFNKILDDKLDKTKVDYVDVTTNSFEDSAQTMLKNEYKTQKAIEYEKDSMVSIFKTILGDILGGNEDSDNFTDVNSILDGDAETNASPFEELIDDLSKALYANRTISDETKLSGPVLLYGTKYARPVDNMTTAIMKNIINECVSLDSLKNKTTRYLYMDCFGDIVTDDGLVILPGVCNPLIYNTDITAYNPYTVAFMNSYPSVLSRSYYFQVTNHGDVGKYVLFSNAGTESAVDSAIRMYQITENNNVKQSNYKTVLNIDPYFYANITDSLEIITPQRFVFGTLDKWENSQDLTSRDFYEQSPIVQSVCATVDNKVIFPYVQKDDTNYKIAAVIALNTYQHIAYDRQTSTYTNTNSLYDEYIITNFLLTATFGTNNSVGYAKDGLAEYDSFVSNSNSRIAQQIVQYSQDFLEKTTSISGIIGLRSSYEDSILGPVTRALQENWWLFIVVVIIILLFAFMKMHRDLMETIILLAASVGVTYALVFIIPVYMNMFYNVAINNICENLSYEIVGVKAENQDANIENNLLVDDEGNLKLNTSSITLYKVASKDLQYFYNSINVDASEVIGGHTEVLNQDAGVFAEGDSLKINLDILFDTLQITGESTDMDGNFVYQMQASKVVSNNVDYYIPYYQFVDGYVNKLNTLAQVYGIPRSTTTYSDGKSKDNYLVYSYVHSAPFLNPGSYEIVEQEEVPLYISDYNSLVEKNQQVAQALQSAFGTNGDWLGCHEIFTNLTEDSKKTLWAQAMQKNGYYDENWNPDQEKINDLIIYINRQTKDFVFDMENQIGTLTDNTMIKLICLRAIVAFTQRVSKFGNYLYPFSINYPEFSLKDVLSSVFTSNYEMYITCDMEIASYIANQYGWVHLIVFDILVLLTFLFISTIKLVIPILYLVLCILLIVKIVTQGDLKSTLRGYAKSSILIFLLFTVYDSVLVAVKLIGKHVISIYILLFVTLLIMCILLTILSAIASNLMDLGDKTFGEKFMALANLLHLNNAFNNINMQAQTLMPAYRRRGVPNQTVSLETDRLSAYSLDNDIDAVYNDTNFSTSTATAYMEDLSDFNAQDVDYVDDLSTFGDYNVDYHNDLS